MAEAGAFTMTYLPSTSKRPCYCCLVDNNDLNNMELSHITLRTPEIMKKIINENRAKDFLIHEEINYFWKSKDFNIYSATVLDRMHMLDLGITKYLLEYTREYLQQKVDSKTVNEIDHRLRKIPRYPGLIIFKNGLENITKFTANDYRNIMKVIIFIIDNLYDNYKEGGIMCKKLCNVFYKYLKMYMMLRQEMFTDMDLKELETLIIEFCQEFVNIFFEYSTSHCKIPKLHMLRYHVIPSIRLYGFMNVMSTETYETLHKSNVKNPYRSTNKKNYVLQMLKTLHKIRKSSGFKNLLWEFKFTEIEEKVSQIIQDDTINPLHKTGFKNFRAGLEEFLTENDVTYDENFGYFKIYSNASVESMDIIRTSGSFYGSEWFSDVAVSSEKTEWYGKALLLFEFFAENKKDPINLILLQWYDEIYEEMYESIFNYQNFTCGGITLFIQSNVMDHLMETMKSLLWKLLISDLQALREKLEHENSVDELCIEGMHHLINYLDAYLDDKSNVTECEDIYLKIYATGVLSNNEIIYATSKFHNNAKFSDIAIAMDNVDYLTDDGLCYGKILMIAEILFLPNYYPIFPIVLVHWFNTYGKEI
ncbi:hypothetical protein GLOIN_2v1803493 [Rhizophagus irregularis DAOM 181602=DAOM 197198]|uniref:Uncharacterized protein n=1 Tax=Rhizophagus irregularis (strain DAOM 181602 / DAOM 197198 / MUCL 43194) TaxID=747089 RepID=A0A2P4QZM2_RHIID|nr:hypothetical protein GLOIN_2v1803493 [Rhizophagus irregularis DAOM 181602=DAOM 197198]POG83113.1 hypothetical protein GLOIN_2v1803493 [Rhizophagus irregularis DAOM 181602=DAOM 197198]|eukprot:XP_025189979.1 hypothetical protein GLOIN_2v1803493 [Rhizophagus irregularis DAOM 181602=DAOM 197198]